MNMVRVQADTSLNLSRDSRGLSIISNDRIPRQTIRQQRRNSILSSDSGYYSYNSSRVPQGGIAQCFENGIEDDISSGHGSHQTYEHTLRSYQDSSYPREEEFMRGRRYPNNGRMIGRNSVVSGATSSDLCYVPPGIANGFVCDDSKGDAQSISILEQSRLRQNVIKELSRTQIALKSVHSSASRISLETRLNQLQSELRQLSSSQGKSDIDEKLAASKKATLSVGLNLHDSDYSVSSRQISDEEQEKSYSAYSTKEVLSPKVGKVLYVKAPETLPEGYAFEAKLNNKVFLAVVVRLSIRELRRAFLWQKIIIISLRFLTFSSFALISQKVV